MWAISWSVYQWLHFMIQRVNSKRCNVIIYLCFHFRITFDFNNMTTARFSVDLNLLSGWNHVTVNYLGPNNGQGIRVYRNGLQKGSDDIKFQPDLRLGDDRTAVGRLYTKDDGNYGSFENCRIVRYGQVSGENRPQQKCDKTIVILKLAVVTLSVHLSFP